MRCEALVEAREQVLAAAEVAVGAGPHVVAGLRRDHELVAEGREILLQQGAERLLGGAVGRAVVVGEVEVRDAEVEGAAHDRAARLERPVASEVLPEAERDRRQQQPAAAAAVVGHAVVAIAGGQVGHAQLPRRGDRPPDDTTSRAIRSKSARGSPAAGPGAIFSPARRGAGESGGSGRPAGAGVVDCGARPVVDFGRQYATAFRSRLVPRADMHANDPELAFLSA